MITLPVILIILAIVFDFGVALTDYTILTNATRAVAREMAQGANETEAQQSADRITQGLISRLASDPLPAVNINRPGTASGDPIYITITYDFNFLLLPRFLSGITNIELTATSVMRTMPN